MSCWLHQTLSADWLKNTQLAPYTHNIKGKEVSVTSQFVVVVLYCVTSIFFICSQTHVSVGSQIKRAQASVKQWWLCNLSHGWLDGLSLQCEQTVGRLWCICWLYYWDDWMLMGSSLVLWRPCEILPRERDCIIVSSLALLLWLSYLAHYLHHSIYILYFSIHAYFLFFYFLLPKFVCCFPTLDWQERTKWRTGSSHWQHDKEDKRSEKTGKLEILFLALKYYFQVHRTWVQWFSSS